MIPKILHLFWEGDAPEIIKGCKASAIARHPDWQFKLWDASNVGELGIDALAVKKKSGHWANVANLVRLLAVNKYGGVWLDSDCEVLKPLDPLLNYSAFAAIQDSIPSGSSQDRICNAVFGATPNHPWLQWQVDHIGEYQSSDPAWGVYLMSEAPRDGLTLVPTLYFYPYTYDAPKEKRVAHPDSYLVHRWIGSWG